MKKSSIKQPCAYHESNLGGVLVNKHITIKILLFLGWKNDILQWKSNCKYNLEIRESAPANYKKRFLIRYDSKIKKLDKHTNSNLTPIFKGNSVSNPTVVKELSWFL